MDTAGFRLDAEAVTRADARRVSPWMVWAIAGAAGLAGLALGHVGPAPRMDGELVPLLRFMAVIKGGMACGAGALVHWRLRREAGVGLAAALVGSAALMMAGAGLVWGLVHLVAGAVVFHAGLLVFLVAAARDGLGMRGGVFFSEEKNQKTFISALAQPMRPWPANGEAAEK